MSLYRRVTSLCCVGYFRWLVPVLALMLGGLAIDAIPMARATGRDVRGDTALIVQAYDYAVGPYVLKYAEAGQRAGEKAFQSCKPRLGLGSVPSRRAKVVANTARDVLGRELMGTKLAAPAYLRFVHAVDELQLTEPPVSDVVADIDGIAKEVRVLNRAKINICSALLAWRAHSWAPKFNLVSWSLHSVHVSTANACRYISDALDKDAALKSAGASGEDAFWATYAVFAGLPAC